MFSRFQDYKVLESIAECYRVLQSITEYYRVLQSVTECYRVLQSVTECCRVFLAHLLGPIFGLVFLTFVVFADPDMWQSASVYHDKYQIFFV